MDDSSDNYLDTIDEMVARATHVEGGNPAPSYVADNDKVWTIISNLCRDEPCWTYVKPSQRARNGRGAFYGLYDQYLGPNNVDNMANMAESKLESASYHGERRGWNFEKYTRMHVDQHTILNGLREYGYSGIDDRSKVRHFINGIKVTALDPVKTQVMANPALRISFSDTVSLYSKYISQKRQ